MSYDRRGVMSAVGAVALAGVLFFSPPLSVAKGERVILNDHFSDEVTGSGADLVFIPGLGSSRDTWKSQAARLKGHYRIHLLQVAGFAGEPARANATGEVVKATAEAIDAYLVAQHLSPAVIVGHSLGGTIVLYLAELHPDHLKKAMMVDTLPFVALIMGNPKATVEMMTPIAAGIRANTKPDSPEQRAQSMTNMAIAQSDKDMIAGWSAQSDQAVFRNALADDLTLDLRPGLAKIVTPLTLVYPDYAPLGAPQGATDATYRGAYSEVQGMKFVLVSDSLHFIMLDQPRQFDVALDAFLAP
jgi:pimeloyl-[acyl-carrier protein] methyl ester esterase